MFPPRPINRGARSRSSSARTHHSGLVAGAGKCPGADDMLTVMMLLSRLGDSAAGRPISPGAAWDC